MIFMRYMGNNLIDQKAVKGRRPVKNTPPVRIRHSTGSRYLSSRIIQGVSVMANLNVIPRLIAFDLDATLW